MKQRTSALAIVLVSSAADGYHVLTLVNDGERVFPKGHIRPGETPSQAAVREVREEAGVSLSAAQDLGQITQYAFFSAQENCQKIILVQGFLLDAGQPITVNVEEGFTCGDWLPVQTALKELTHHDARRTLELALKHIPPAT